MGVSWESVGSWLRIGWEKVGSQLGIGWEAVRSRMGVSWESVASRLQVSCEPVTRYTTSSYTLFRYHLNDLRYSVVENGRWMSSFLWIFLNREDGSFFFNPRRLKVNIHQKGLRPRLEANDSKAQTFFKFNSAFRRIPISVLQLICRTGTA